MVDEIEKLAVFVGIIGFFTEFIVEFLKKLITFFISKQRFCRKTWENIWFVLSLATAVSLCFWFKVSLFEPETHFYTFGIWICGAVSSRGSSFAHNWFDNFTKIKKE
jgi:FtsH-binding integral membrane protein